MLHITNGDVAVERMREGNLRGDYLAWQDVLHDGPVPLTATLEELSAIRVRHLAAQGYGEEALIAREFAERDAMLESYGDYREVVFWFEHDLYDQLQLIQVLDWMGSQVNLTPVSLIVIGAYPGIDRFVGLGQLTPAQLVGLLDSRVPAMPQHFAAASQAWRAFRQPDPRALAELVVRDDPLLPFLRGALMRLLEELPATANGLSRTERTALGLIAQEVHWPPQLFAECQSLEQRPWLGDWSFWKILSGLTQGMEPLIETRDGRPFRYPPLHLDEGNFGEQWLQLTRAGHEVLENRRDAIKLHPIDRWLGGTHLQPGAVWRWDEEERELLADQ